MYERKDLMNELSINSTCSRQQPVLAQETVIGLILFLAGAALVILPSNVAFASEHTRVTNPNALSLELFGRGLLYGIAFDRVINDDMVVGVSYGRTPLKTVAGGDTGLSAALVPAYFNYYFTRSQDSVFASAGATLVANSDDAKDSKAQFSGLEFSSTPVLPTLGVGFESRGDTGFLFRVAGYAMIGKSLNPWFGFSMGYAF